MPSYIVRIPLQLEKVLFKAGDKPSLQEMKFIVGDLVMVADGVVEMSKMDPPQVLPEHVPFLLDHYATCQKSLSQMLKWLESDQVHLSKTDNDEILLTSEQPLTIDPFFEERNIFTLAPVDVSDEEL